jgi:hypothetical protein
MDAGFLFFRPNLIAGHSLRIEIIGVCVFH